jgi:hypothetical protein
MFRSLSHTHAIFPPISSGCLHSCGVSAPMKLMYFNVLDVSFLFFKTIQRQIQQGLFEYNIYRQKK